MISIINFFLSSSFFNNESFPDTKSWLVFYVIYFNFSIDFVL